MTVNVKTCGIGGVESEVHQKADVFGYLDSESRIRDVPRGRCSLTYLSFWSTLVGR